MGGLMALSQSSLLLLAPSQLRTSRYGQLPICRGQASLAVTSPLCGLSRRLATFPNSQCFWRTRVVSDSKVPTTFTVDSAGKGIDFLPDSGGSNDNFGGPSGNGGGGGGYGGNNDDNNGVPDRSEDQSGASKNEGMSMSQKLTLGYAALVGIGGVMGYLKSGSQEALIAGGFSASLLYFAYTLLPSNPVLASSLCLGLSASLVAVMGSRFMESGKIIAAVIDSFASLAMAGILTLGCAALVGIGGVMDYLKSGSQKSLIAGGFSASLLYFVYTLLPSNPVLASFLGLGLSASLVGVMGSRFINSGKIFPAGIVFFASLVMAGGYLHGFYLFYINDPQNHVLFWPIFLDAF